MFFLTILVVFWICHLYMSTIQKSGQYPQIRLQNWIKNNAAIALQHEIKCQINSCLTLYSVRILVLFEENAVNKWQLTLSILTKSMLASIGAFVFCSCMSSSNVTESCAILRRLMPPSSILSDSAVLSKIKSLRWTPVVVSLLVRTK